MTQPCFIVVDQLNVGGTERHLSYVLPPLVQKGVSIEVVCLRGRGPMVRVLEEGGIGVRCLCPDWDDFSVTQKLLGLMHWLKALYDLYKQHPQGLFHYFLPRAYIPGVFMALLAGHQGPRLMSRRFVNIYQRRRPFWGWIERRLHQKVTFFIANSQEIIEDLKSEGVPESKIAFQPNGIPIPNKVQRPKDTDALTMMIVANLMPYKGHEDLFHALALIRRDLPQAWRLWIVGRDPLGRQQGLEDLAKQLKINEHIEFKGLVAEPQELWSKVHIALSCSHEEGLSNAVLEAMARGVAVITTRASGASHAMEEGVTGLSTPPGDSVALSKAIHTLAHDPKRCQEMGKAGRQRAMDLFSLEACVASYLDLYETHHPSKA